MPKWPAWSWISIVAAFALLILIAVNVIEILMKPGSDEQIKRAILEMREASVNGKPGGVLEYLSSSFRLPSPYDAEVRNPLGEVGNWVRNADIERLDVTDIRPEVYGEQAIAKARLVTSFRFVGVSFSYDGPIELNFRRETHRRLFIIPEHKWLVTGGSLDIDHLKFGML